MAVVMFAKGCRELDKKVLQKLLPREKEVFLRNLFASEPNTRTILNFFCEYFDKLYFSSSGRPNFLRCAKVSCSIFIIIACLRTITSPSSLSAVLQSTSEMPLIVEELVTPLTITWVLFCLIVATNIIGDYFSLWETRIVLSKLQEEHHTATLVVLWIVDVVATLFVFYAMFHVAQIIMLLPALAFDGGTPLELLNTILEIYSSNDFFPFSSISWRSPTRGLWFTRSAS